MKIAAYIRSIAVLLVVLTISAGLKCSSGSDDSGQSQPFQSWKLKVIASFPHDPEAFTQGLLIHDGYLYESTGLNGKSSIRKVELASGRILKKTDVDSRYFAEGLARFDREFYQLTWRSRKGFRYQETEGGFSKSGEFSYASQGWGLTHDGTQLLMTDGTAALYFISPKDFSIKDVKTVMIEEKPVPYLNELEYVKGQVYANVWLTNDILIIDPTDGRVVGKITVDPAKLLSTTEFNQLKFNEDVLNGIAYDSTNDKLYITGKRWPKIFHVELVPTSP